MGAALLVQVVNSRVKEEWDWKLDAHAFTLALLESFAVSQLFTLALKTYTGRHRPDFYARLDGGDEEAIASGMRSYPSGLWQVK